MKPQLLKNLCCNTLMAILMALATGCSTEPTAKPPEPQVASPETSEPGQVAAEPDIIEPQALDALTKMSGYLRSLKTFKVGFKLYKDEVLLSGQKIMVNGTSDLTVQRPDHFHFTNKIDEAHVDQQYFYDGKNFTVYGNTLKLYAVMDAPPTIAGLLDVAYEKHGISMPFADLFIWGTDKADFNAIKSAIYIGPTKVNNIPCDHYAFRNEDVDWQLWIEQGAKPLPRKLVITTAMEEGQPQAISIMDWNLSPKISKRLFTFTPPKDAHKIEFAKYDAATETSK